MKITYLSHSVFILENEERKILIDPFIKDNPNCPFTLKDVKDVTDILVTHGHRDHLGDTIELAKLSGAKVIVNFEMANYLKGVGLENVHDMHIGGTYNKVKMVPAIHGSSIEGAYAGLACGFVIEMGGVRVYHAGDTALTMDMKLLKNRVDIALLPIGDNYTMGVEDVIRAVKMIKPKVLIPMHYNTFPVIEQDPYVLKDKIGKCELVVLEYGKSYETP